MSRRPQVAVPSKNSTSQVKDTDREWYDAEEVQHVVDLSHNEYLNYSSWKTEEMEKVRRTFISKKPKRYSAIHEQKVKDTDRWEASRLHQSGLVSQKRAFEAHDDDDHSLESVQIIVHETSPPFLPEAKNNEHADYIRDSSGIRIDPINPVKDPTSDIAQMARKGSFLVKEVREKRERVKKMKALEGDGSTLGNIMGKSATESDRFEDRSTLRFSELFPTSLKDTESEDIYRRRIREQRQFLPAFAVRDKLLQMIRENPVVIVVGETGSGKTTQLAQFLNEDGFTHNGKYMIGCTQPRRVAAVSVAKRVAEEMNVELGGMVGYAIRFEDCVSKDTRIKFMTDGVLLRESLRDGDLENYSCIIIDEAHERSLQTDVLLGILKKISSRRSDLRIIVTSATMDSERFSNFFFGAPIFNIPGRTFPVECLYAKTIPEDYVDACVKQALSIHVSHPPGDILIFMTGQEDIEATCCALQEKYDEHLKESVQPLLILPIYSQLPSDLQAKIFNPAPEGSRKLIVATNIAETSLTVDGIRYVIDSGLCKIKVYNARIGMDALTMAPISQASANQRAGRAGRTGPGYCFRMYPESVYHYDLLSSPIPEIQRTNLSNVVLLLKSLGVDRVENFDFIDCPTSSALRNAQTNLWTLGCLDDGGNLTPLGRSMVEFPLDPTLSKMLIMANSLGCINDILIIVSMLSVPSIFQRPKERMEEADAMREKFTVPESDLLTYLNVYKQWKSNGMRESWCSSHFLHYKALYRAEEVLDQLKEILKQQKIEVADDISSADSWKFVRQCIASASISKAARMNGIGQYVNLRTGMPCFLHPTSSIFALGFCPEYVVYHELILTSKEYMHGVTYVDPKWLAKSGPMVYSLRIVEYNDSKDHMPTRRVINFSTKNSSHDSIFRASEPKKEFHGSVSSDSNDEDGVARPGKRIFAPKRAK